MKKEKLVVLGSINVDHILKLDKFPTPGETLVGEDYTITFGGKGANQAVAAGRSGADITFIGCVGDDEVANNIIEQLNRDQIDTTKIKLIDNCATGVALIFVDKKGENSIGIYPGANDRLTKDCLLEHHNLIIQSGILLMQLESPLDTVIQAAKIAKENKTTVILNPAPAQKLPAELFTYIDIITPNETEIEYLTGIKIQNQNDCSQASRLLHYKGVKTVIITLGSKGVWLSEGNKELVIPGFEVDVVDTIAAGDTFNGALATRLLVQEDMLSAIKFAQAAAAITVTRAGAQTSIPWKQEIKDFLSAL